MLVYLVHPDKHIRTHFSTVEAGRNMVEYDIVKEFYKLKLVADGEVTRGTV